MASLYRDIMNMADRLDAAANLLRRMATGDADAATLLAAQCHTRPYEGDVLEFKVGPMLAQVFEDDCTGETPVKVIPNKDGSIKPAG